MEQTTNYYIDNRTQVVINQPTRTVMVTNRDFEALMNAYNSLMNAYESSISAIAAYQENSEMNTGVILKLCKENTALKAEVKELKSRLYALPE